VNSESCACKVTWRSVPIAFKDGDITQSGQKVSVHLMIQHKTLQVLFKVSSASLQTLLTLRTVSLKTVFVIALLYHGKWLKLFKIFCVFFYCNHQVHRGFLITLYMLHTDECRSAWGPVCILSSVVKNFKIEAHHSFQI
jgi:hypothetical protein